MCILNPIYNSLDVRYTVFSSITNFVSDMTLGHVVSLALGQVVTLITEQIECVFGVNRANCDTVTNTWHVTIL